MDSGKTTPIENCDSDIEVPPEDTSDLLEKIDEVRKLEKSLQRWQKILLAIVIAVLLFCCVSVLVLSLRIRGANNLKADEQYITYNEKKYRYRDEIVNILCLGIDKTVPISHIERKRGNIGMSDAILLVSINTETYNVNVLSIPRDTMTDVQQVFENGQLGEKKQMQICYQYAYGISMEQSNQLTVDAVSHLLYDTPIQRCCAINFEALPIINDAIGGVDVIIEEDLQEFVPEFVYGEKVHLKGKLALSFVRSRNTHRIDGTLLRAQRQKQYALAFAKKAKEACSEDMSLPITIFQELTKDKNMCTDITVEDISYLAPCVLRISFSDDMMQVLPGESEMGEDGFAEYHMDRDSVKKWIIDNFYEEV